MSEARRRIAALAGSVSWLRESGRGEMLVTMVVAWFLLRGVRNLVPAVLVSVKADFAIDNTTAGVAVTLLWVAYALTQVPTGILTDRIGERVILIGSMAVTTLSLGLFAGSGSFHLFVLACVLFGLGSGLFSLPRVTLLSRTFPENEGKALGVLFSGGSVGAAVLPFVGGVIAARLDWRGGFLLLVCVAVPVLLGLARSLGPGSGSAPDTSNPSIARIVGAVRRRSVLLATVTFALVLFTFQGLGAFLPLYLVAEKSVSQGVAAALYGLYFGVGAVVQPVVGHVSDQYGERRTLIANTALYAVTLFALPFVRSLPALTLLLAVMAFRSGIEPISQGHIVALLPDEVRGSSYGVVRTVFFGIGSMGSVVIGALADANLFDEAFVFLAVLAAVSTVLYARLPPPRKD